MCYNIRKFILYFIYGGINVDIIRKEYTFKSSTGLCDVYARSWSPKDDKDVKAIFQIAHGMAEHGERYAAFAKVLCEHGFAVFINDHVGHGKSVKNDDYLGYFGEKDGWMDLIIDCRTLTDIAKEEYPDRPVIFFGHSMGSFVARNYTAKYNDVQAAIYCGTGGKNPAVPLAITIASILAKSRGSMHRSTFINNVAFGAYNKKYKDVQTAFDWLSKDRDQVQKYIDDKYCGFLFTCAGYRDLFSLLDSVSNKLWYEQVSTNIPILLVSGDMDPVGDYGKGVKQVAEDLEASGHNVTLKLFEDDRHEILNEIDHAAVKEYVADWADNIIASL